MLFIRGLERTFREVKRRNEDPAMLPYELGVAAAPLLVRHMTRRGVDEYLAERFVEGRISLFHKGVVAYMADTYGEPDL
ncbi:hypothetical protein D3C81_759370 [compost metagenome]